MRCRPVLVLLVLAGAAAVGCGGDDPPVTAPTGGATPATDGAPEAPGAGDLCTRFSPEQLQPLLAAPLAPVSATDEGFCRYADTDGATTNLELRLNPRLCEDFDLTGAELPGAFGYADASVNQASNTFRARLPDGNCLEVYVDTAVGGGSGGDGQLEALANLMMGAAAG